MVRRSIVRGSGRVAALCLGLLLAACRAPSAETADAEAPFAAQLRLLGSGNWLVVADGSFPLHSVPGITTLYVGGSVPDVAEQLLHSVDEARNVAARLWRDVGALDPAAEARLLEALGGRSVETRPSGELLADLPRIAAVYDVVVLKTDDVLPSQRVFVELVPAYGR